MLHANSVALQVLQESSHSWYGDFWFLNSLKLVLDNKWCAGNTILQMCLTGSYNLWHQLSHNCVYIVTQGKNQELFQSWLSSEMKWVTLPLTLYCNQKSKSLTWRWHIFAYLYRKSIDHKTTSYDVNYQLPCTGTGIQVRSVCFDICRIVGCVPLLRQPVIPTAHYSDDPLLRRPIFPTI